MPGFVHVDIAADDPERASRFYGAVFGWAVQKLEGPTPYWLLIPPGDSTGGGIAKREETWQTATPTIDVASAEETEKAILAAGGTIVVPRTTIPGVGELVTFRDTEGNVLAALEAAADNAFAGPPAA